MSTTTYLWIKKKTINTFWLKKKVSYLGLYSTFNNKTAPLIRPLLDSTKGGLGSGIYCICS